MKVIPVIMAGGAGTRLWPMSNEEKPKQFHNVSGKGTLLEETIERLRPLSPERILIVTARAYKGLSMDEIAKSRLAGTILCEPRPRNTAAAILYAAKYLEKISPDSIMIALPADHYIGDAAGFAEVLKLAVKEAETGRLITIGIKPSYPETGYGYIRSAVAQGSILNVEAFVEKPDLDKAKEYVSSGNYYWNSGIFVWKTSSIISAFEKHLPEQVEAFSMLDKFSPDEIAEDGNAVLEAKKQIFDSIESVSIDNGILEKAGDIAVIPGDFGWADLGSWISIDGILKPDIEGNRSPYLDRSLFVNSSDCTVLSEECSVAIVGLSNVIVVQSGSNILVMDKGSSQDVRKVVELVKGRKQDMIK